MKRMKRLWNKLMTVLYGPNVTVSAVLTKADGSVVKYDKLATGRARFTAEKS